jgi:hypothetical protein
LYKSRLTFHILFSKIKTENVRGATLLWGKIYYIDFPREKGYYIVSFPGESYYGGKLLYNTGSNTPTFSLFVHV